MLRCRKTSTVSACLQSFVLKLDGSKTNAGLFLKGNILWEHSIPMSALTRAAFTKFSYVTAWVILTITVFKRGFNFKKYKMTTSHCVISQPNISPQLESSMVHEAHWKSKAFSCSDTFTHSWVPRLTGLQTPRDRGGERRGNARGGGGEHTQCCFSKAPPVVSMAQSIIGTERESKLHVKFQEKLEHSANALRDNVILLKSLSFVM